MSIIDEYEDINKRLAELKPKPEPLKPESEKLAKSAYDGLDWTRALIHASQVDGMYGLGGFCGPMGDTW